MLAVAIPSVGVAAYLYEKSFRDIFILLIKSGISIINIMMF